MGNIFAKKYQNVFSEPKVGRFFEMQCTMYGSLGPPETTTQTASHQHYHSTWKRRFLHSSRSWQTDRPHYRL